MSSYFGGRWKCWDVALHAGSSHSTCMGGVMWVVAVGFVGQMIVTGGCCLRGDDMITQMFGASGMGR